MTVCANVAWYVDIILTNIRMTNSFKNIPHDWEITWNWMCDNCVIQLLFRLCKTWNNDWLVLKGPETHSSHRYITTTTTTSSLDWWHKADWDHGFMLVTLPSAELRPGNFLGFNCPVLVNLCQFSGWKEREPKCLMLFCNFRCSLYLNHLNHCGLNWIWEKAFCTAIRHWPLVTWRQEKCRIGVCSLDLLKLMWVCYEYSAHTVQLWLMQ